MAAARSALVLVRPSQAEVRRRGPQACGPGEALVRVAAVGVCATDVELFDGSMGYFEAGLASWPLVPGHEWTGEILALGEGAPPHLRTGQRVIGEHITGCEELGATLRVAADDGTEGGRGRTAARGISRFVGAAFQAGKCEACAVRGGAVSCPRRAETGFFKRDGAFQTEMLFPARQLHILPNDVPWDLAVLAEPLSTACKAVRVAGLMDSAAGTGSSRVVIVGDGPVGLLVLQVLRWRGASVACVVGANASRLSRAEGFGAEAVWDVSKASEAGLIEHLEGSGGRPATVIEAAGHPSAVPLALSLVRPRGHVVLLGLSGNRMSELRADDIVLKQITVSGSLASEPEDWDAAAKMLSSGAVEGIVTHKLRGLGRYEEAIGYVRRPPDGMLKVALYPAEDAAEDEAPLSKRQRSS